MLHKRYASNGIEHPKEATKADQDVDQEQIVRFEQEVKYYINMTEVEQRLGLSKQLPSVEAYLGYRMGTSAVRVCLAITELVFLPLCGGHLTDTTQALSLCSPASASRSR